MLVSKENSWEPPRGGPCCLVFQKTTNTINPEPWLRIGWMYWSYEQGKYLPTGLKLLKDKATGLFGAFVRYLCCRDLHVQEIRAYEGGDMSFFEEPEEPQGPPPKKAVLLLLSVYS